MNDNRFTVEEEQIKLLRKQLLVSRIIAVLLGIIAVVLAAVGVVLITNVSGLAADLQQTLKNFNDAVVPALENLDIDSLNQAIENLGEALKPFSGMFGR